MRREIVCEFELWIVLFCNVSSGFVDSTAVAAHRRPQVQTTPPDNDATRPPRHELNWLNEQVDSCSRWVSGVMEPGFNGQRAELLTLALFRYGIKK